MQSTGLISIISPAGILLVAKTPLPLAGVEQMETGAEVRLGVKGGYGGIREWSWDGAGTRSESLAVRRVVKWVVMFLLLL